MVELHLGDCREVMAGLDAESVDAIVTDPPAGIAFMGKDWDRDKGGRDAWVAWLADVLRECWRVAKPGAHALVWALPRTSGWTHRALEDAGWEVRDCCVHLFGSGFPKSHNLPGGLGTALKPGAEFWYLARKPLSGTVAATVAQHGTGALNIDATRIASDAPNPSVARRQGAINHLSDRPARETEAEGRMVSRQSPEAYRAERAGELLGRWPANVILDEAAAQALDEAVPASVSRAALRGTRGRHDAGSPETERRKPYSNGIRGHDDHGGPSRFFYCAKASRSERNAGLAGMPEKYNDFQRETCGLSRSNGDKDGSKGTRSNPQSNHHPTVKPLALMRWLVRLICPPGGLVLDPFAGSGTTGCAAALEGMTFLGIEQDPEYLEIARRRIAHYQADPSLAEPAPETDPDPAGWQPAGDLFAMVAD